MSPQTPRPEGTLLDAFLSVARNKLTIDNFVLECESEQWTFGELDTISSALALELYERFGAQITVASIHENHPYILALLLATWKLGGIFAPLDAHAPPEMLVHMLKTINPTCAAIPDGPSPTRSLTDGTHVNSDTADPFILHSLITHSRDETSRAYNQCQALHCH